MLRVALEKTGYDELISERKRPVRGQGAENAEAGGSMRPATQKLMVELLLLCALLVLFCDRIWRLGVMHTDEAIWALRAYDPNADLVGSFARSQGRLWAFPIGTLMLHAAAWNETVYGHLLKVGSFAAFFLTFHAFVWVFCGRRLALLCATLFLALNVLRWEESNLTTVPLLSWGSATLALIAILVARFYVERGKTFLLPVSGVLLFIALFCNEGVALFFVLAFPWCLIWTASDRSLRSELFRPGPTGACSAPISSPFWPTC